ncbi:MAG: efflux RND transporter permease subunit [Candidatus Competibacterales bacterium]
MARAFVANPRLLALAIALVVVAGLAALAVLPRTEDPRIRNRVATVLTPFAGATAERVEALVSEPIEDALQQLPEVKVLESKSQPGLSVVTIELADQVIDTSAVWSSARDELADIQVSLPAQAGPSTLDDSLGYAYTQIFALGWTGAETAAPPSTRLAVLGRYAEEFQSRLRRVAGTDWVDLYGQPQEEITARLDLPRLAALGLTVADVQAQLIGADAKVAAGALTNAANRLVVEVTGELDSLERVRQVPLRTMADGQVVRLGHVALVERSLRDPPRDMVVIQGTSQVVVGVRMLPDVRIEVWSQRIERALADFRAQLPANVQVEVLFDQARYTATRLGDLVANVLMGFAIITGVLFLTLGVRSALVVAAALPLTTLFTLACMNLWGLPIHQMSVTGLVVALGIMVDNAIVLGDTLPRFRAAGASRVAAASRAIAHLWLPLLGSTLTTILTFAPIALMPGPAGEFVSGIALSVMFALVGSYLISHTIVAGLGGRFLTPQRGGLAWPGLGALHRATLVLALRFPWLTLVLVMAVPLAGFVAASRLTEQFFPPSDRNMFHIELWLPAQISIWGTLEETQRLSQVVKAFGGIDAIHWFVGASAPAFYYNLKEDQDQVGYFAEAMITTQDFRVANRAVPVLQDQLDAAFPGAQILVRKLEQRPPLNAPIEVRLYGPDLAVLQELGDELRRILLTTPDVLHARATLSGDTPKVQVAVTEEALARAGWRLVDLAGQLQGALEGAGGGSVLEDTQDLPVRLRIADGERRALADLAAVYIPAPRAAAGEAMPTLPLQALGALTLVPAKGVIPRRDGQRVNVVEGYVRAGVLPQTALERFQARLAAAEFGLPADYRLEYGGESASRNEAVDNLLASVGVIAVLLLAVVVLSFNSFRLAALIMVVAFQAPGLGLLAVYSQGYPFGFTVIIGLMGLVGLAINAAIIILAELKNDPAAAAGERGAIVAGVSHCTRHITSTTITTAGGFMPLILAGGGFWPPFAVAIAGGTVLTTLLSLYLVPVGFSLLARRRAFAPSPGAGATWAVAGGR